LPPGVGTADDAYEARLCITESEQGFVLRFTFDGDDLRLEIEPKVSWGRVAS
jgi:hypothetical protein